MLSRPALVTSPAPPSDPTPVYPSGMDVEREPIETPEPRRVSIALAEVALILGVAPSTRNRDELLFWLYNVREGRHRSLSPTRSGSDAACEAENEKRVRPPLSANPPPSSAWRFSPPPRNVPEYEIRASRPE